MRKLLLLLTVILTNWTFAQEFEKTLGNRDDVDMVLVTKDMFALITEIDTKNNRELKDFYGRLDYLATFSSDRPETSQQIYNQGKQYALRKRMRLLTKIKDQDKVAEFYYLPGSEPGYAKELILLIRYPKGQSSLMQVKGNINMKKISLLALQATMLETSLLKEAEKSVR